MLHAQLWHKSWKIFPLQLISFTARAIAHHALFRFSLIALSKVVHYSNWEAKNERSTSLGNVIRLTDSQEFDPLEKKNIFPLTISGQTSDPKCSEDGPPEQDMQQVHT